MICRSSRNRVASAIQQLDAGQITWADFDALHAAGDMDWTDEGLRRVYDHIWVAYDPEYPQNRKPDRSELARLMTYLHSDVEYGWRHRDGMEIVGSVLDALTFRLFSRRLGRWLSGHCERQGKADIWPFISRQEYETCQRNPRPTDEGP